MDQSTRVSRLPTSRFSLPLRRRPVIGRPIGPVEHNVLPMGFQQDGQVVPGQRNATEVSMGRAQDCRPALAGLSPNTRMSSVTGIEQVETEKRAPSPAVKQLEETTHHHWPLPKSRTLNHVFSGITNSFSRSSLDPSRRSTKDSSTASLSDASATTPVTCVKVTPSTRLPVSKCSRWSLGSHKLQLDVSFSRDPCFIYDPQPSAYWTGRFMSLHDKFQSEALTPKNMQALVLAHSSRNKDMNNQRNHQSRPLEIRYSRYNTRLPPSATSAAILQQTSGNMADAIAQSDAALLLDEDERCKRVFVHLEAFCATDEARTSLHTWQQEFARKTGRKKLLPKDGVMHQRHSGSYISRIIGGKRIGKRASVM
ncbi:hypothetical protein N0V93_002617 [Gnomoniopsis smithogilvyi]|uniref:Uncharacterized protein n=1 Tax=Gnomoniopsis smithogilvyi TaxID=1191159 RepID=A0A9W8YVN7_9PEZI|nr:hypothetical protein N0V93_002617 [Gnomoniopsis smithogilvyi]